MSRKIITGIWTLRFSDHLSDHLADRADRAEPEHLDEAHLVRAGAAGVGRDSLLALPEDLSAAAQDPGAAHRLDGVDAGGDGAVGESHDYCWGSGLHSSKSASNNRARRSACSRGTTTPATTGSTTGTTASTGTTARTAPASGPATQPQSRMLRPTSRSPAR